MSAERGIFPRVVKAVNHTKELVDTISKLQPAKEFTGLPTYRFRSIVENLKQAGLYEANPEWLLAQALTTPQEFVDLCNRFEKNFIAHELARLEIESDEFIQGRIVVAISRSIVRGDLDVNKTLVRVKPNWKKEITTKVGEYRSGQKPFDGLNARDLFKPKS